MRSKALFGLIFTLVLGLAFPVYAEDTAAEAVNDIEAAVMEGAPGEEPPPVEMIPVEAPAEEAPAVEAEAAVEGAISAVDLKSESPSVTVKAADGAETRVDLDLDLSLVLKGDEELALEDLAAGQNVRITQADFDGKLVADTIEIV
jgi:hypothetical protein